MWHDVQRKLAALVGAPTTAIVRARGHVWHLSPQGVALFGGEPPNVDAWCNSRFATIIKRGAHRIVYRVALPNGTIFVKHCRLNGLRAWAREFVRLPKARLEFENAQRLCTLGIGAAVPLAWGVADSFWPSDSFIITQDLAPAVPLTEVVNAECARCNLEMRRQFARCLGRFLAHLHNSGVTHPDPHPGNVLVELGPALEPRFYLLDVHAVRFGAPLTWPESRANLVLFNRWFQLRASPTDRHRFWRAYRHARHPRMAVDEDEAAELERLTRASNRRFWIARTARYKGTHRTVRQVCAGTVRGLAVCDLPDCFLWELLANPEAVIAQPGVRLLKQDKLATVAELPMATPDGPRAVIWKRVGVRSVFGAVKNLFRASAVWRSWLMGHGLRERWLPTPRPLAMFHRYCAGALPAEGYLLTEKVPDAVGLSEAVEACREVSVLRAWAERLARVVRTMHDRGISHRDLKAPNILLRGAATEPASAEPVLIDLVGVRASVKEVPFAQRVKQLARLNASFLAMPQVTRTERLRFLRVYLAAGEKLPDWKRWWGAVVRETQMKVAKNARRGRVLR